MVRSLPAPAPDWSATGLGTPDDWPGALRVALDIVHNCPAPMLLMWGPQRTLACNQAYAALSGTAAPAPGPFPAWCAACASALEAASRGDTLVCPALAVGPHQRAMDVHLTPLRAANGQVQGVLCAFGPPVQAAPQEPALLRILVVEDNLDAQYLVCEMLRAFGHEVQGLGHAEDALPLLAAEPVDVLFTDVSLPGMSGVELARRALRAQPGLQVIFASGYGDGLLQQLEFAHVSLQKPYELDALQAELARIAALRRRP